MKTNCNCAIPNDSLDKISDGDLEHGAREEKFSDDDDDKESELPATPPNTSQTVPESSPVESDFSMVRFNLKNKKVVTY